ncbi:MAG: cytidylate kinase-like family protein [Clostridia bacterium]
MTITIGCEYASGGEQIGKKVAEILGIEYYDRDLVDRVVEKTHVDRNLVEQADQKNNVKFQFETKFGARTANLSNRVMQIQFDVIKDFANKSSCVIIGRCGDYILKDFDDCLHVFIYAPEEVRVETLMKEQNITKEKAITEVKEHDEMLKTRYRHMTGTSRGDRRNRNMLIDSSILGFEKTAELIVQFAKLKFE